jgi:hypothetical protein
VPRGKLWRRVLAVTRPEGPAPWGVLGMVLGVVLGFSIC